MNDSNRGGKGQPGVDAANPRANNTMGRIIRWKEDGDFDSLAFQWNRFVLAGDPADHRVEANGNEAPRVAEPRSTSAAWPQFPGGEGSKEQ